MVLVTSPRGRSKKVWFGQRCHVASLGQVCQDLNLHREGLNRFDLLLIWPAQVGLVLQLVLMHMVSIDRFSLFLKGV